MREECGNRKARFALKSAQRLSRPLGSSYAAMGMSSSMALGRDAWQTYCVTADGQRFLVLLRESTNFETADHCGGQLASEVEEIDWAQGMRDVGHRPPLIKETESTGARSARQRARISVRLSDLAARLSPLSKLEKLVSRTPASRAISANAARCTLS